MVESSDNGSVATATDVLSFWRDAGTDRWYKKSDSFDADIRTHFLATYQAAAAGKLSAWADTAAGALALLILLDQFPRNMFRHSAQAFATDPLARSVAAAAIAHGFDKTVSDETRQFFYLPFMHSEALADQERCVALIRAANLTGNISFAEQHADIIRRFGRFPHRNAVLGRTSSTEEQAFLDAGGFAG